MKSSANPPAYDNDKHPAPKHPPIAEKKDSESQHSAAPMMLLDAGCREWGLSLTSAQLESFEMYYQQLVLWNKKFNLTAITDYEDVQTKHFLDSLSGLPLLSEELGEPLTLSHPLNLIDVGTGAGFPGIPLKMLIPSLNLTLLDGTQKKIHFLEQLTSDLDLDGTTVVKGRAEEIGRQGEFREQFDVVTARAVAALNTLVEYLLPLVRVGGYALIYKGGNASTEFVEARHAISLLGGETVRFAPVEVPYLDQQRFVLLIKKTGPTPNSYPRGQGLARKQPLTQR